MLSTTDVAAMAATTRHTVEREIGRRNLRAEKTGRTWVIEDAEAERWAAQFRPYAGACASRGTATVWPQELQHGGVQGSKEGTG